MSVEALKSFFDWGAGILIFLTFAFGVGALITGNIINKRQENRLRQFDKDLTDAKIGLGRQQERAAILEKNAADAKTEQQKVEIELEKQRESTAKAEQSLLELRERIKPRSLTDKQSADFVEVLRTLPNGAIKLGHTSGGGDEALNFLKQLMPLFKEAGWKIPETTAGVSYRFDVQVIGIGILVPGPKGTDPRIPLRAGSLIKLTPVENTLRTAFKVVGMDVKFINWYPSEDGLPELVVGSKPNYPGLSPSLIAPLRSLFSIQNRMWRPPLTFA